MKIFKYMIIFIIFIYFYLSSKNAAMSKNYFYWIQIKTGKKLSNPKWYSIKNGSRLRLSVGNKNVPLNVNIFPNVKNKIVTIQFILSIIQNNKENIFSRPNIRMFLNSLGTIISNNKNKYLEIKIFVQEKISTTTPFVQSIPPKKSGSSKCPEHKKARKNI